MDAQGPPVRVSPFRHLRIVGHLPLPAAFRSLSRLSSALSAKASALRPFLLDLFFWLHSVAALFLSLASRFLIFLGFCFNIVLSV